MKHGGIKNEEFSNLIDGYFIMNNVRRKKKNGLRNSGGNCVLIKEYLMQENFIRRIYDNYVK